jgi:hypothetical protein
VFQELTELTYFEVTGWGTGCAQPGDGSQVVGGNGSMNGERKIGKIRIWFASLRGNFAHYLDTLAFFREALRPLPTESARI